MKHEWKLSWPGNYCLKCGIDDPIELALAGVTNNGVIPCPDCKGQGGKADCSPAWDECERCGGQGIIINPELVVPPCIPDPIKP